MRSDGFKEVYELEGGIIKWRAKNLAETTENKTMPAGYLLEDFQKLIQSDKLVLIDFYADWCEPCLRMKPFLEELTLEQASTLKIIRINADDNQALLKSLNIEGLPLHGLTLETILVYLVEKFGWEELSDEISINCFRTNPSLKSSLTFLRKTPWARTKVEGFYLYVKRKESQGKM